MVKGNFPLKGTFLHDLKVYILQISQIHFYIQHLKEKFTLKEIPLYSEVDAYKM